MELLMPEMHFWVRWPDGSAQRCYSPSLVVEDFLIPQQSYLVEEFVLRSGQALEAASERVRQKFGFRGTAAGEKFAEIERRASEFRRTDLVMVEEFE
jgi:uncharacterized repeat protein (TIGR04042 family)